MKIIAEKGEVGCAYLESSNKEKIKIHTYYIVMQRCEIPCTYRESGLCCAVLSASGAKLIHQCISQQQVPQLILLLGCYESEEKIKQIILRKREFVSVSYKKENMVLVERVLQSLRECAVMSVNMGKKIERKQRGVVAKHV